MSSSKSQIKLYFCILPLYNFNGLLENLFKFGIKVAGLSSCLLLASFAASMQVNATDSLSQQKILDISENNDVARILCDIFAWFTGVYAKIIIAFIIVITGLGFLLGKISWGIIISVGIAAAIMSGAGEIVGAIAGEGVLSDGNLCKCKGANCAMDDTVGQVGEKGAFLPSQ
jgi:type IV secretory pathway VirB2 component (pilin)